MKTYLFTVQDNKTNSYTSIGIASGETLDQASEKLIELNQDKVNSLETEELLAFELKTENPQHVPLKGTQLFIC